jgi:hypothetical protein
MKRSAQSSFAPGRAGTHAIRQFLETFAAHDRRNLRVHLAAHSTGSLMLAALLEALETLAPGMRIRTCSLFAPAASIDLFKRQMYPWLAADAPQNGIDRMVVYTLSDALEHGDRVAGLYGKSLLHLVSRAYEEAPDTPLLGLERHARSLMAPRLELVVSQGPATAPARCMARTHGEFDNDVATMNDLLHTILERPPDVPFTADTLEY